MTNGEKVHIVKKKRSYKYQVIRRAGIIFVTIGRKEDRKLVFVKVNMGLK